MNDPQQMSPSPDSQKQRIIEKSAFEDDDEESESEEDEMVPKAQISDAANALGAVSGGSGSADGVKRTLSDTVEEAKVQEAIQKAQAAKQQSPSPSKNGEEQLSAEDAERRSQALIQQMLREEAAQQQQYFNENGEDWYDEQELPDEQS